MTSSEVVTQIITVVKDAMTFMIPVIGILAGLNFVLTWVHDTLWNVGKRTFKG